MKEKFSIFTFLKTLPLVLLVSLVPLIVQLKVIPITDVAVLQSWNGENFNTDFFSYYKAIAIMVLTAIMVFIFLYEILMGYLKIKKTWLYVPMGAFTLLIVLSSVLAEHREVALMGYVDRYEGMWVWLCYMAIMFICINYVDSKEKITYIISGLVISSVIISVIGIFQYIGMDIFKTEWGKLLMLPKEYEHSAEGLNFTLGEKGIYSTLFHYNFVGSYMAMMFPFTAALMFFVKNKLAKFGLGISTILLMFVWIASNSRAGVVGGCLAIGVFIILMWKVMFKHWKATLAAMLIFVVGILGADKASDGKIFARLKSTISYTDVDHSIYPYKDIVVDGAKMSIIDEDKTLIIEHEGSNLILKDTEGNKLDSEIVDNIVNIKDERYSDTKLTLGTVKTSSGESFTSMDLNKRGKTLEFILVDGGYKIIGPHNNIVDVENTPKWGFMGRELMGSSRGYIWSRSIPMLKDSLILGNGADTYSIYFPQTDYIGKMKGYGTTAMVVDKPHNVYLQIGINTGVVSLVVFLVMIGAYCLWTFIILFKNKFEDFYSVCALAILIGIVGYLGAGFFNDSVVGVAPIFWVFLGSGFGVNYKLTREN